MGAQLGVANVHQGDFLSQHFTNLIKKLTPYQTVDSVNMCFTNTGIAGRVYVGYQFATYFAVELGYYRFKTFHLNANAYTKAKVRIYGMKLPIINYHPPLKVDFPIVWNAKASITTYAVDLTTKGILPLTEKLSLYGKIGVAYINVDAHINLSMSVEYLDLGISADPSANIVYPEFGLGLSYDFTEHVSSDMSWMHIQRFNKRLFPNIDFVSIGFLYRF